jgi:hypothetical protein
VADVTKAVAGSNEHSFEAAAKFAWDVLNDEAPAEFAWDILNDEAVASGEVDVAPGIV